MASSSGNGGRRSSARSSGKGEKQSRKTQDDDSDKICGFHPLRSLRNIFFGYRTRGRPPVAEDAETSARAKSTDDIVQKVHQQPDVETTKAVIHAPVAVSNSTRLGRPPIPPMMKQLSKSADNLVSDWIPAPHGIPSAVNSPSGSEDSSLNASMDEIDGSTALDPNSVDEFFTDKWSQVPNSRTRAFSSGDAEVASPEMTFDLDSVAQTTALNVSAAKNRITIKPKDKRLTVAMQQKMLRAETTPRPTKTYHLQSVTEADEDGDEGKKERTMDPSATAASADAAEATDKSPAIPDRPIRREKKLLPPPDKSGRMTINITPDMLAGARKKASDRGGNSAQGSSATNPRPNLGPPPPTIPKKRKTICEPEKGTSVQEEKMKEESREEPAENGAATGVCVTRRPLLSVKEDEVFSGEEGEAAKPKAPPRVRPKTRPKTMMHTPAGEPKTTEAEPAEWMTRVNKKNALID